MRTAYLGVRQTRQLRITKCRNLHLDSLQGKSGPYQVILSEGHLCQRKVAGFKLVPKGPGSPAIPIIGYTRKRFFTYLPTRDHRETENWKEQAKSIMRCFDGSCYCLGRSVCRRSAGAHLLVAGMAESIPDCTGPSFCLRSRDRTARRCGTKFLERRENNNLPKRTNPDA